MKHELTAGYIITRDLCEMEDPKETDRTVLVDLGDLARRIDEEFSELRQQLASQQAYAEQLREALNRAKNGAMQVRIATSKQLHAYGALLNLEDCIDDSLRNAHDTTALQEYAERIAKMCEVAGCYNLAERIRKGEF